MTMDWIIMNMLMEQMNIIHNDDDAKADDDDDDDDDGEVGGVKKKNDLWWWRDDNDEDDGFVVIVEGCFILNEYYVCTWFVLLMDRLKNLLVLSLGCIR